MQIPERIEMPAPTAWPLALAFGMTLVFAGFVTAESVSILGAVLAVSGIHFIEDHQKTRLLNELQ